MKNTARDYIGASPALRYTQAAAENFITEIRVTHDDAYLYFYLQTEADIRPRKDQASNWMNLFLSVRGRDHQKTASAAWEGFHYVLNRAPVSDTLTSLERVSEDGAYVFESVQHVPYSVQGNVMQIAVPFEAVGITAEDFWIDFKVADSVEQEADIMDYYVSGCAVPLGRLTYSYSAVRSRIEDYFQTPEKDRTGKPEMSGMEIALLAVSGGVIAAAAAVIIYQYRARKRRV